MIQRPYGYVIRTLRVIRDEGQYGYFKNWFGDEISWTTDILEAHLYEGNRGGQVTQNLLRENDIRTDLVPVYLTEEQPK